MTRKECLEQAAKCVLQNRQDQYGDVEDCFKKIARLWNAYLPSTIELEPFDVACMMALLKIARIQANPKHGDSWVDLAGYAACGADIAVPEPFRYDKPEAEGGCCQNGNDQQEFKPGDAVEWFSFGRKDAEANGWHPAFYLCKAGDPNYHVMQDIDGMYHVVNYANIRSPEAMYRPGDKVEALSFDGSRWEDAVVERMEVASGQWHCTVRLASGERHCLPVAGSIRRPSKARAEGCEALVEKDAPQTPQELCKRIIDANPATFHTPSYAEEQLDHHSRLQTRKPTSGELAEMAEEEKRG